MSAKTTANSISWTDTHTIGLVRGIIATTLSARSDIYSRAELQEVSNNGGDRINKQLQRHLKRLTAGLPGAEKMVEEEVAKLGKGKKGSKSANASEQGTPTKKRKVKEEIKDEREEEEEE